MIQNVVALLLLSTLSFPLLKAQLQALSLTQQSFNRTISLLDQHSIHQHQKILERC